MYTKYWKLLEAPFENQADPRFAYLSDQHREGLARLLYLVRGRKQGGVLTGPYGVGKSMILELVGQSQQSEDPGASRFIRFDIPPGGVVAFGRRLLKALGDQRPDVDSAVALERLEDMQGRHTVVAIDEAQLIDDPEVFRFLQRLTNLRRSSDNGNTTEPAFTLLLAGHVDLIKALEGEPSLRQRLSLVWNLDPLDEHQTAEYVRRRIEVAGGNGVFFDDGAIREVHRISGGLPRRINNLCDLSLMMGCAVGAARIERDMVLQAAQDGLAS